jgi:hypothetical protein
LELFEPFDIEFFPAVFRYPAFFGENLARSLAIDRECFPFFRYPSSFILLVNMLHEHDHDHDLGSMEDRPDEKVTAKRENV